MIIETAANGQADASGVCRVRIGPPTAVAGWLAKGMTSQVSGSVTEAQLLVYKNYESPSSLVNSSVSANTSVSTQDDVPLMPGDALLFVWNNVTPGAWCTATIRGEEL